MTRQNRQLSDLKKQRRYYSGKKKRHTLKTQILVDLKSGEIISLAFAKGRKHDFQLFKDSHVHVMAETTLEADTGYQGLAQLHTNSLLPKKRSKNHPLSKQQRKENREKFQVRQKKLCKSRDTAVKGTGANQGLALAGHRLA